MRIELEVSCGREERSDGPEPAAEILNEVKDP